MHVLIGIELLLQSVALQFVLFAAERGDVRGQVFAIFVLAVAAGEAAVGLALLIALHRRRRRVDVEAITELRG